MAYIPILPSVPYTGYYRVQTTPDEAALFRSECLYWQRELGLMDWALHFKTLPADGTTYEAAVEYETETRQATITYYMGVEEALHPSDVALHEILHLLFADMMLPGDPQVQAREEHRVIERLLKVLPKRRRK